MSTSTDLKLYDDFDKMILRINVKKLLRRWHVDRLVYSDAICDLSQILAKCANQTYEISKDMDNTTVLSSTFNHMWKFCQIEDVLCIFNRNTQYIVDYELLSKRLEEYKERGL